MRSMDNIDGRSVPSWMRGNRKPQKRTKPERFSKPPRTPGEAPNRTGRRQPASRGEAAPTGDGRPERNWPGKEYGVPDPRGNSYTGIDGRTYGGISESASDPWRRGIARGEREAAERAAADVAFAMPEGWQPGDPIDYSGYAYEDLENRFTQGEYRGERYGYRDPRATYNDISGYRLDNGEWTPQMQYEGALFEQFMRDRNERLGFASDRRGLSGYSMDDSGGYTYDPFRNAPRNVPGLSGPTFPKNRGYNSGGGAGRYGGYGGGGVGSSSNGGRYGGGGGGGGGGYSGGGPPDPADYLSDFGGGGSRYSPMGGYGWDQSPWGY